MAPASGGDITLSWGPACATGSTDYEIYEGTAGNYYSHSQRFCSTGGLTAMTFTPSAGDPYYLVVGRNALREGSYGLDGAGAERPQGFPACLIREEAACP